jgi:hypothetical protein
MTEWAGNVASIIKIINIYEMLLRKSYIFGINSKGRKCTRIVMLHT